MKCRKHCVKCIGLCVRCRVFPKFGCISLKSFISLTGYLLRPFKEQYIYSMIGLRDVKIGQNHFHQIRILNLLWTENGN